MANNLPVIYISYEDDYPLWSDIILGNDIKYDIDDYIKNIITAIEWSSNKIVKAIKLELNNEDTSRFKIEKSITYKVEK